jgi:hypothetical protein
MASPADLLVYDLIPKWFYKLCSDRLKGNNSPNQIYIEHSRLIFTITYLRLY